MTFTSILDDDGRVTIDSYTPPEGTSVDKDEVVIVITSCLDATFPHSLPTWLPAPTLSPTETSTTRT